jgi:ABC-2 type transport system permease protein
MFKFLAAVRKECLLLLRDKAGMIILFLMPMVLIVIMSLMQEGGWSAVAKDPQVPVLFVDNDHDSLGFKIRKGLVESNFFKVIDTLDGHQVTRELTREAVKAGKYQIGIVIPKGVTKTIRTNVRIMVAKTLAGFGLMNPMLVNDIAFKNADTVSVYFDPAVRSTFKNAVVSSIKEKNYRIETEMIFRTFNTEIAKQFPSFIPPPMEYKEALEFKEIYPSNKKEEAIPNTVQHNVPAWTVFAMFFIIIPLTGSMIKEREEGSLFRLLTMPVSYMELLMSKVAMYFIVCMIQCVLMILAGMYILPLFHIPTLVLGHEIGALVLVTILTALAALGYGLLVGTVATSHQQAAAFGAVSIIILAALGGLWVPTYLMPEFMTHVSVFSPLNWSITAYYSIFLREGGITSIFPQSVKLFLFFLVTVLVTFIYRKVKSPLNN